MALIQSTAIPSAATDYDIDRSLRFNDDDSPYLSWTPSSAGNRKAWTFSCWVKRASLVNGEVHILGSGTGNSGWTEMIRFDTAGSLTFVVVASNTVGGRLTTNALFRDTSAWYHIIGVWDSANSTASDRIRLYVNGSRLSSFSNETLPSQNLDSFFINNTNIHALGLTTYNNAGFFDGYLSEVNFIDGQALTSADFGQTGTYGEWKPKEYSGTYGTNGFYLNFSGGGIISSATGGNSTGTTGDYKYKTYTSSGTFTPSSDGYVEYLVVGGGGGGGSKLGGGGGGGGFRTGFVEVTGSTAYTVTVGAGGAYDASGSDSSISGTGITTITATGGGHGGAGDATSATGGSGGGGAGIANTSGSAGTSGQGNAGGDGAGSNGFAAGGGGGAGAAGADGPQSGKGGDGGAGLQSNIDTNNYYYSGGGGGGAHFAPSTGAGDGGIGGGGGGARGGGSTDGGTHGNGTGGGSARNSGGSPADAVNQVGGDGGANTGGGGGGAPNNANAGGAGGSGIVIIRYKFQ
jgi:hypothetical protein